MQIDEWLGAAVLELKDIATARLDALVLLGDITGKDRAWLLAHPEQKLTSPQVNKLSRQIKRRANHEPLAYIRGKSEFYGREFKVTPATLQPRPETETMVDLLEQIEGKGQVRQLAEKGKVIIDVGTGSGCLAITAKLEWPQAEVYATEINENALEVAEANAKNLKANVKFLQGNLLDPILNLKFQILNSVLLCNLPYVPNSHTINKAAMQEPKVAIFGGEDGLDLYREMFGQIKGKVKPEYILTESLPFQHNVLAKIAKASGYKLIKTQDFIQLYMLKR